MAKSRSLRTLKFLIFAFFVFSDCQLIISSKLAKRELEDSKKLELEIENLINACSINQLSKGHDPGSKLDCCPQIAAYHCLVQTENPYIEMVMMSSLNTTQCTHFLIEPVKCEINFEESFSPMLQLWACTNSIVMLFGMALHQCCFIHFRDQCFRHNFDTECESSWERRPVCESIYQTNQMTLLSDDCRSVLDRCPTYSPPNLKSPKLLQFLSNNLIGIVIVTFILLIFVIVFRCRSDQSQPENDGQTVTIGNSPRNSPGDGEFDEFPEDITRRKRKTKTSHSKRSKGKKRRKRSPRTPEDE